jgi:hypothetical protein
LKRAPAYDAIKIVHALPVWLATHSAFHPVNIGIFLAAPLFGMNA